MIGEAKINSLLSRPKELHQKYCLVTPDLAGASNCNTYICVTLSEQFAHLCTVCEPSKGLEIEGTHKGPGSFKKKKKKINRMPFI